MGNLRVGEADVEPDRPSHTPGVNYGNEPGGIEGDPGIYYTGENEAGRPQEQRNPIDPNSPTLPPP